MKAKLRPKKKPRKRHRGRVFIIGAGVSASCGIAVASQILRESMLRLEGIDTQQVKKVHKLLRYLYPNFDNSLRNYPNIEDFLNLLEMAKKFNSEEFIASDLWAEPKLDDVKNITLKAVTEYIWQLMADTKRQQIIRDFVRENLREGDTVVTFNWDLTFERALEEYPRDPGFFYKYSSRRERKYLALLKPHGSIDWFARKAVHSLVSKSDIGILDDDLCYYPRFNRAENPRLAEMPPVIIPPVAEKEFEFPFLKRTWRYVFRAVTDATDLHVIGYSLPKEDQFARFVFRRAIRNNIVQASKRDERPVRVRVINPDPAVEGTFSRLVGREVQQFDFRQAFFEDYVASLRD
jgi:hypothetical protein